VCSTEDLKAKKKAMVEAELHEAISALKKPNRQLAGRSIVEDAERRASYSSSQTRSKHPPLVLTAKCKTDSEYRIEETKPNPQLCSGQSHAREFPLPRRFG